MVAIPVVKRSNIPANAYQTRGNWYLRFGSVRQRFFFDDEVNQIEQMFHAGVSVKEIASKFNTDYRQISSLFPKQHDRVRAKRRAKYLAMFKSGMSIDAIAESEGVSVNSVRNGLYLAGHKFKTGRGVRDDLTVAQLAYIAGIIDGEGYIGINRARGRYTLEVAVANTEEALLLWLQDTIGAGLVFNKEARSQKNPLWNDCYSWRIGDLKAADMLRRILPYLVLKRDQAQYGIAFQSFKTSNSGRRLARRDISAEYEKWKSRLSGMKLRNIRKKAVENGLT